MTGVSGAAQGTRAPRGKKRSANIRQCDRRSNTAGGVLTRIISQVRHALYWVEVNDERCLIANVPGDRAVPSVKQTKHEPRKEKSNMAVKTLIQIRGQGGMLERSNSAKGSKTRKKNTGKPQKIDGKQCMPESLAEVTFRVTKPLKLRQECRACFVGGPSGLLHHVIHRCPLLRCQHLQGLLLGQGGREESLRQV